MNTMLKTLAVVGALTAGGVALSLGAFAETAATSDQTGQSVDCPVRGPGMGPGAGRGYGKEGMHGREHGPRGGWGMLGGKIDPNRVLSADQIRTIAQAHLIMMGNDNLKIGKTTENKDKAYDVQIVTKDNSLVNTVAVSKATGMPVR